MHPHVTAVVFATVNCAICTEAQQSVQISERHSDSSLVWCAVGCCFMKTRLPGYWFPAQIQYLHFPQLFSLSSRENMTEEFVSRFPGKIVIISARTFQMGSMIIFIKTNCKSNLTDTHRKKPCHQIVFKVSANELTHVNCLSTVFSTLLLLSCSIAEPVLITYALFVSQDV